MSKDDDIKKEEKNQGHTETVCDKDENIDKESALEGLKKKFETRVKHAMEIAGEKYWRYIKRSSEKNGISIKLILAIGARESDWGLGLKPSGEGGTGDWCARPYPTKYRDRSMPKDDLGYGRGLMQIDYDWHEFARTGKWYKADENIEYGAWYLAMSKRILNKFIGDLYIEDALIASYNLGLTKVRKMIRQNNPEYDLWTSGGDYVKWVKSAMIIGGSIERAIRFSGRRG